MQYHEIILSSTDVSLMVFIEDTRRDDGGGLTGLQYNSSGLVCYYALDTHSFQCPMVDS
jgi:hypothetical protein